jgi:hypothetical protein
MSKAWKMRKKHKLEALHAKCRATPVRRAIQKKAIYAI